MFENDDLLSIFGNHCIYENNKLLNQKCKITYTCSEGVMREPEWKDERRRDLNCIELGVRCNGYEKISIAKVAIDGDKFVVTFPRYDTTFIRSEEEDNELDDNLEFYDYLPSLPLVFACLKNRDFMED